MSGSRTTVGGGLTLDRQTHRKRVWDLPGRLLAARPGVLAKYGRFVVYLAAVVSLVAASDSFGERWAHAGDTFGTHHRLVKGVTTLIGLGVHLVYWSLLTHDLLSTRRPSDLAVRHVLFPLLLMVSYLMADVSPSHAAGLFCFMCTYGLWAADEAGEQWACRRRARAEGLEPTTAGQVNRGILWLSIDGLMAAWLAFVLLIDHLFVSQSLRTLPIGDATYSVAFGIKEMIIAVNLGGYVLVNRLSVSNDRLLANHYYRVIGGATRTVGLRRGQPTRTDTIPSLARHHSPIAVRLASTTDPVRVVDVYCGGGNRTMDTLAALGIPPDRLRLTGVDWDATWEPTFRAAARRRGVPDPAFALTRHDPTVEAALRTADVLVFAHVIHQSELAGDIREIIRLAPPNALILFEVCGPDNFLSPLISEVSIPSGLLGRDYYRGEADHLPAIATGLRPLDAAASASKPQCLRPFALIKRRLRLDAEVIDGLVAWVEGRYGIRIGVRIRDVMTKRLTHSAAIPSLQDVPFDDVIYALVKPDGDNPVVTVPSSTAPGGRLAALLDPV